MRASASQLTALTKELSNQWQQTKFYWKDAKCEEFERLYMEQLTTSVEKAAPVIAQLDQLIRKIRGDCE